MTKSSVFIDFQLLFFSDFVKIVRSQFFEPRRFNSCQIPHEQLSRMQHLTVNDPEGKIQLIKML